MVVHVSFIPLRNNVCGVFNYMHLSYEISPVCTQIETLRIKTGINVLHVLLCEPIFLNDLCSPIVNEYTTHDVTGDNAHMN